MKIKNNITLPILIIALFVNTFGIINIFFLSNDGIVYKEKNGFNYVEFVQPFGPAYFSNIQPGDRIISIQGKVPKSLYDLKGNLIEKAGAGHVLIYTLLREEKVLNIPLKLGYYYSRSFVLIEMITLWLIIFTSFLFYYFFKEHKNLITFAIIFYSLLSISHICSLVSFTTFQIYIFLIISSSLLPSILLHFVLFLRKTNNTKYLILIYATSFFIMLLWLFSYMNFAFSLKSSSYKILMDIVKITQVFIVLQLFWGIILLLFTVIKNLKNIKFNILTTMLILFLLGFSPYIFIYALPVIFGKKEILPVNFCLTLSTFPFIGAIFYKLVFKNEKN